MDTPSAPGSEWSGFGVVLHKDLNGQDLELYSIRTLHVLDLELYSIRT